MNRTAIFAQCTTPDTYLAASPDGRRFFPISERPPALRHYPGLRLRQEPPAPAVPAPVLRAYDPATRTTRERYSVYFTPGRGDLAVTNRYTPDALAHGDTLAEAWAAASHFRGPFFPDSDTPDTVAERPVYNTTRERARRGRQAQRHAAGAKRREKRAALRELAALAGHYRREYDARQTWARITVAQRRAKVAEYREALKQYARLREFNRLIREHNARHSPYEGLL
jgi:hypothetical protein